MYISDLIEKLSDRGIETIFLEGVEREYEITRYAHDFREAVIVFTLKNSDIKCYTNILSSRNMIYTVLGVDNDLDAYNKIIEASNKPSQLNTVAFDNYFHKTELDLDALPFIKYFREDGGYYLTSSIIISCIDSICNSSFHRIMYIDRDKAVVRIVPRHLYHIYNRYREEGKDTPVAIILGVDPVIEIASASTPPYGVFEISIAATINGDNRVVKTPRYNIPVPATASIVLEGVLSHEDMVDEGPFVDILGLVDIVRKQPVFYLENIYVNRETGPMYHAIVPSLWEHMYLMGFPREAMIYESVRKITPNIKGIRLSIGSGGWLHAIISIKQEKPGEARNAGLAVINAHPSVKHVIVVDDDIDIDDPYMVEWAIATRVKGGEDIIVLKNIRGSTLDPRNIDGVGDKVLIDATKPYNEPWSKYRRVEIP